MLVHRRVTLRIKFAGTHLYTWVERGTARVKYLAQEHNTMPPARTRAKSLLLMINAFVFSKLFYCSTVWGNTSKSNIKKLQLVQNFAGKIVLGLKKFDHISQGLKSLGWLSIEDKLRLNTAVMVHKCLQHRVPIYLKDKFVYRSQVHNRQLRSVDNNELNLPHCRLSTGQRSFAFRGAKVWNSLPLDLKLTSSLRTFKKNVCELLVNNLS